MHLIQVLLPLYDNSGSPLAQALYRAMSRKLANQFGGLTAYTRAPAEGLWQDGGGRPARRDDLVIYEVMAEELDREWWSEYRRGWRAASGRTGSWIRVQRIEMLLRR